MMKILQFALGVSLLAVIAAPAAAQSDEDEGGTYVVARAGTAIDTDLRFPSTGAPNNTFQRDTDFRRGLTGEIGIGQDFGSFRLEGTVGYASAKLNRDAANTGGFTADGRSKALMAGLSAYADLPISDTIVPYVGAGVGVARVDARLSRVSGSPAVGSRFDDKDWGFLWHADAGLSFKLGSTTALELGGRYQRITGLRFDGTTGPATGGASQASRPRADSLSVLAGVRIGF